MEGEVAALKSRISQILHKELPSESMVPIPEEDSTIIDSVLDPSPNFSYLDLNISSPRPSDSFNSSLPSSAFKIRNIDTGEEIDIRDENKALFSSQVSKLLKSSDEYFKTRRTMNEKLWESIEQNDLESVVGLLDKAKHGNLAASANAKGLNDWTSLHMAASDGLTEICKILIKYGEHTDIDARTSINRTPLHLATIHNHPSVVELLITNSADINAVDNEYNSALHYASSLGHLSLVSWLLTQEPNLSIKNNLGRTAFDLALNSEIFQVFISRASPSHNQLVSTPYSRIIFGSALMHNSREDHIYSILLKAATPPRPRDLQTFNDRPKLEYFSSHLIGKDLILPGHKIGPQDFKALCQLGKGSFGEVYLVEKIDSGDKFAMKVLRKDKLLGSNLIKYAFAERNILLNVNHPFIVKLNFAFQTRDKLAMVMDFCPNGDLGMHIARDKMFTEEKARFYACEVLLALEELHKHGIIFRDLKPDNVVLDHEGHARLTDFGLSKEGLHDGQLAKSFCGSVAYLAPEMLRRSGHSKSVDWYLFGVLLYEMLVGSPPFYSSSREQLFFNIQKAKLAVPKTMSSQAKNLIKLLMNRDPSRRLGSSKRDSEEVKSHPFFKGVNWNMVVKKQVTPPAVREIKRIMKEINLDKIFQINEPDDFETPKLDGWSVLIPS